MPRVLIHVSSSRGRITGVLVFEPLAEARIRRVAPLHPPLLLPRLTCFGSCRDDVAEQAVELEGCGESSGPATAKTPAAAAVRQAGSRLAGLPCVGRCDAPCSLVLQGHRKSLGMPTPFLLPGDSPEVAGAGGSSPAAEPPPTSSSSPDVREAWLGVRGVWVAVECRRQGIARLLIDCARRQVMVGCEVPHSRVAFFSPALAAGAAEGFQDAYTGRGAEPLVYALRAL